MIWIQGLTCFAIWIAYGYVRSRNSEQLRLRLAQIPRQKKALAGAGLMLLGAAILFATLVASYAMGGFTPMGMTLPTWLLVAVAGLGFVHAQMMAMAMLVALMLEGVVTSQPGPSSDQQRQDAAQ
jgi:uncharacterized membrane protein